MGVVSHVKLDCKPCCSYLFLAIPRRLSGNIGYGGVIRSPCEYKYKKRGWLLPVYLVLQNRMAGTPLAAANTLVPRLDPPRDKASISACNRRRRLEPPLIGKFLLGIYQQWWDLFRFWGYPDNTSLFQYFRRVQQDSFARTYWLLVTKLSGRAQSTLLVSSSRTRMYHLAWSRVSNLTLIDSYVNGQHLAIPLLPSESTGKSIGSMEAQK
ncbi:hypothetical protein VNO77_27688 [Canavalia gladiata]|uniref:Uncharacterized protein n=1 Tax=Canavalia gladiata TaxID=3824 RepID=A0AAN9KUG9_CANGL